MGRNQEPELSRKQDQRDLSPSICEEALSQFSQSDDSLAGIIEQNHIEVRDFLILSFVCDQNAMSVAQLSGALGLSHHTVIDCLSRLIHADLAATGKPGKSSILTERISPTAAGRLLTRRILGN